MLRTFVSFQTKKVKKKTRLHPSTMSYKKKAFCQFVRNVEEMSGKKTSKAQHRCTMEYNVIDIIYVEEPGIQTVSTDRCATIVRGPDSSLLVCFEKNFLNIEKNLGKRRQEKEKP